MKSVLASRLAVAAMVGMTMAPVGISWAEQGFGLGGSASSALNTRFYATLMGGVVQTDGARELDDIASTLSVGGGWQMNEQFAIELLFQNDAYEAGPEASAGDAALSAGSVRGLIYPTAGNIYAYGGLGYGQFKPQDDAERSYDSVLWALGVGYSSGALQVGPMDLIFRAELGFRADMHSGSQTSPDRNNSFNELAGQLGVIIPFGERAQQAEQTDSYGVSVVPVFEDSDADKDGVDNLMDACPGTASGTEVDMLGCAL